MEKEQFDLVIIGSGVGGYVAAIRASQRGAKVALIEEKELGGTCLNRGCIPSKALIASAESVRNVKEAGKHGIAVSSFSINYAAMKERKDRVVERLRRGLESLITSNKITVFKGRGKLISENEIKVLGSDKIITAEKIILATGSEPRALPSAPFDYKRIHDSTSMLEITELPKSIIIIGGGIIGSEFASLHAELGVEVTVVELLPMILSTEGKEVSDAVHLSFKKRGIRVELNAAVQKVTASGDKGVTVTLNDGRELSAEMALIAVGRKLNTDDIGLEKAGVIVDKSGAIPVNERMETNVSHIYAIGDITAKWLLAHVASHQGVVAADNATGYPAKMHYNAVPSVTFTHPEAGTVGLTIEKAKSLGFDAKIGKFPFQALGRSQATMETEGFAQVVIDKKTGAILGAQVVGSGAQALISEMTLAISGELTVETIAETIHAHPTTPEAWHEASLAALGMVLHLPKVGT